MHCFQKCFFTLAVTICCIGIQLEAKSFAQKIAMDATGAGIVLWNTESGTINKIQASSFTSSGIYGAPVDLSTAGVDCSYPMIVMNSNGDAVALWSEFNSGLGIQVLMAVIRPSGGSWQTATQISSNSENVAVFQNNFMDQAYRVVINDLGVVIATWTSTVSGSLVVRSSRFASGSWSAPVTISP